MNLIETKRASLYPKNADVYQSGSGDDAVHHAYMVLGHAEGDALVIEGSGPSAPAAIEHVVRKCKMLRDWMDLTTHGAFWQVLTEETRERVAELRQSLGLPGGGGGGRKSSGEDEPS